MKACDLAPMAVAYFCLIVPLQASESVTIRLTFPEGRTAIYKHIYKCKYASDQAEHILPERIARPGRVGVELNGMWKSREQVRTTVGAPDAEATPTGVSMLAKLDEATSRVVFGGQILSNEQWEPYDLAALEGRKFSWRITPEGEVRDFKAEFREYELHRQDLVTDLGQLWMPEYHPTLPEGPVTVGDTWKGTRVFESRFLQGSVRRRHKALVNTVSSYRLKKLGRKKGRMTVEIEEKREIDYTGWLFTAYVSVVLRGEGTGLATWVIDVDRGLVLSEKTRMKLRRPEVFIPGRETSLGKVIADYRLDFERKLDKLVD